MAVAGSAVPPPGTGGTGAPVRGGYWRTSAVRADMVHRYVQDRQPMWRIAVDLGCSYGTVHAVLTAEGVKKRSRGGSVSARRAAASSQAPGPAHSRQAQPNAAAATTSGTARRGPGSSDGDTGAVA